MSFFLSMQSADSENDAPRRKSVSNLIVYQTILCMNDLERCKATGNILGKDETVVTCTIKTRHANAFELNGGIFSHLVNI